MRPLLLLLCAADALRVPTVQTRRALLADALAAAITVAIPVNQVAASQAPSR